MDGLVFLPTRPERQQQRRRRIYLNHTVDAINEVLQQCSVVRLLFDRVRQNEEDALLRLAPLAGRQSARRRG